jgi:hypothetical protein
MKTPSGLGDCDHRGRALRRRLSGLLSSHGPRRPLLG